jgi:hypothetical protein
VEKKSTCLNVLAGIGRERGQGRGEVGLLCRIDYGYEQNFTCLCEFFSLLSWIILGQLSYRSVQIIKCLSEVYMCIFAHLRP